MQQETDSRCGLIVISMEAPAGRVLWANESYCSLLGYEQKELLNLSFQNRLVLLHPDDQKKVQEKAMQQLRAGQELELEYRALARDGSVVWQLAYGYVENVDGGRAVRCVVFDLTEIRAADKKLKSVNRRMEVIISNLPGGIFLYKAVTGGKADFISDGALQVFRCTREMFYKKYESRIDRFIYEEDRENIVLKADDVLPQAGTVQEFEYRIVTGQGELRWVRARRQFFADSDDTLMACVLIMDVDELRRSRETFLKTTREMNDLTDSIHGGIVRFLLDEHFTILLANKGFYKLLGEEDPGCKKDFESILDASSLEQMRRCSIGQKEVGKSCTLDLEIHNARGEETWVNLRGSIVEMGEGLPVVQAVISDITETKRYQQQLEYERERYKILLSCMEDIIFEYDLTADRMTFFLNNPKTGGESRMIEIPEYKNFVAHSTFVCPDDRERVGVLFSGESFESIAVRLEMLDGRREQYYWFEIRGTAMRDQRGRFYKTMGTLHNIDEQKRATDMLRYKSERDSLTQIYNKASAGAVINEFLQGVGKEGQHALLVLDLDDFKGANDTFGHQFGDAVLVEAAKQLQVLFRRDDVVGRVGGDEFVVLMKDVVDRSIVLERAGELCRRFERSEVGAAKGYHLCTSVGLSLYPEHGSSYAQLFERADLALYEAKNKGKNQYALYSRKSIRASHTQEKTGASKNPRRDQTIAAFQTLHGLLPLLMKEEAADIEGMLRFLCERLDASRAYLFTKEGAWYEWCNDDALPRGENRFFVAQEEAEAYRAKLETDEGIFCLKDVKEIKRYLPKLYQSLKSYEVQALAQLRMPGGVLGIEECTVPRLWTKNELGVLSVAARLLAYRI